MVKRFTFIPEVGFSIPDDLPEELKNLGAVIVAGGTPIRIEYHPAFDNEVEVWVGYPQDASEARPFEEIRLFLDNLNGGE